MIASKMEVPVCGGRAIPALMSVMVFLSAAFRCVAELPNMPPKKLGVGKHAAAPRVTPVQRSFDEATTGAPVSLPIRSSLSKPPRSERS